MKTPRRSSALATPLILALACLALAACGSSTTTSTTAASASGAAAGTTGPGGAGSARFAAIRACLAKAGITLPQRPAGAPRTPGAGGGFFGGGGGAGGAGAFGGANSAKVRAALQSCGIQIRTAGGGPFRRNLASNPTAVAALTKFAGCMRSNGINVPNPNTSGTGPVFNTSGLNTTSAAFRAAYAKCTPDLPTGFGRRGTTGPSASNTAPGPSA